MKVYREIINYAEYLLFDDSDIMKWSIHFEDVHSHERCSHLMNKMQIDHTYTCEKNSLIEWNPEGNSFFFELERLTEKFNKNLATFDKLYLLLTDIGGRVHFQRILQENPELNLENLKFFAQKKKNVHLIKFFNNLHDIKAEEDIETLEAVNSFLFGHFYFVRQPMVDVIFWLGCLKVIEEKCCNSFMFDINTTIGYRDSLSPGINNIFKSGSAKKLFFSFFDEEIHKNYKSYSFFFFEMKKRGYINANVSEFNFRKFITETMKKPFSQLKLMDYLDYSKELKRFEEIKETIHNIDDENYAEKLWGDIFLDS